MTAPRVVVVGGHSAGHIEPMMNFADALRRLEPTAEITALGTVRGLDTTLILARGYPLELIPPVPLPRKLNRALLQTPGRLRDSVRAAGAVSTPCGPKSWWAAAATWPCRPTSPPTGRACRSVALVVAAGRRGQGIGRSFVEAAEEAAGDLGCVDMEVTSARGRTESHLFYRSLGYEE